MTLRVQNHEPNTTVFAKPVKGDPVRITWGAKGSPDDTQRVPDSLADDVDFLNTLERGALKVIDGPEELVKRLQYETARFAEDRKAQQERATASIERTQDKDMVGEKCIGPGPEGRDAKCGRAVLIKHSQLSEVPPLCEQHEHLAPRFLLHEEGSRGEGATETRAGVVRREWREATLTSPARSVGS